MTWTSTGSALTLIVASAHLPPHTLSQYHTSAYHIPYLSTTPPHTLSQYHTSPRWSEGEKREGRREGEGERGSQGGREGGREKEGERREGKSEGIGD
eukprot:2944113-Rhodomonas_salina.1